MDYAQLQSWLGLPPGPWPPDHYALLDFPRGRAPLAEVEPRVLQKMEQLRHHQLLHPELVTAGMNRLAQALITLTDAGEKATYDAELGLAGGNVAPMSPPLPPRPPSDVFVPPAAVIIAEPVFEDESHEAEALPPHPTELTQEIVLPAEVIPAYEVVPEPEIPPPLPLALPFEEPPPAKPVDEVVEGRPVATPVRPWPTPPSTRRWVYTRLALIRKARRGWERLRTGFADPDDPLDRPARVLLVLEGAAAVRPHLPALLGVVGGVNEPGGMVAAILRQTLLLDTLRRLLPEQRQSVARDWGRARYELEREHARLRQVARDLRATAEGPPKVPTFLRWLRDVPELALVAAGLFILFLAAVRSVVIR